MVVVRRWRIFARQAVARADQRDGAGNNGAKSGRKTIASYMPLAPISHSDAERRQRLVHSPRSG